MKVFESVKELRAELDKAEQSGIGFVPTMGALHAGHRSLVERARRENGTVVVSVFVNPTQFNDKNDLKHYPPHAGGRCPPAGRGRGGFRADALGRGDISPARQQAVRFRTDRQGDGGRHAPRPFQRRSAGRQPPVRHRAPRTRLFRGKGFPADRRHQVDGGPAGAPPSRSSNARSSAAKTGWPSRRATRCSTQRTGPQRRTSTPRCTPQCPNRRR